MADKRFLRLFVPMTWIDKALMGNFSCVVDEGPRGVFREVRLASAQETGMLACRALPPGIDDGDRTRTES